ncbi:hypothetical protein PRZ48_008983 [Zasmidium cellare]|uniref:F-box domain-containing protein n=1 Tax=Zasmidium cellare TaxID=395010 RepID=A0ABR0EGZ7_ZASCE|nr:hypothetical protein PRZ48_008983 [Zasmidium cellare]
MSSPISKLPTELLEGVFLQLPHIHDIANCKAVNRRFRSTIKSSPALRFMPTFPFADKRAATNKMSRRRVFYGIRTPFVSCINPIFALDIVNLRLGPHGIGKFADFWWTSGPDSPSFDPTTGIVKIRWKFKVPEGYGIARITSDTVLNMHIAHPNVRVQLDMYGGRGLTMGGEIKPETTIKEFLEWSDAVTVEEKLSSKIFVKKPFLNMSLFRE